MALLLSKPVTVGDSNRVLRYDYSHENGGSFGKYEISSQAHALI